MLAISSDFHGGARDSAGIKNVLTRIARAGFSHVHWCHEFGSSYVYSVYEMLQIREWCDELGLLVKGVHASVGEKDCDLKRIASENEYNRLAGVELVKNRIDLASVLETDIVVHHLLVPWDLIENDGDFRRVFFKSVYKSLDELEPYCMARGIRFCFENTGGAPAPWCRVFDDLCERYSSDFVGLCLDTGHANMFCKENRYEYAQRYNDRLFMVHLADNHGETDEHLLPFDGTFDWEGFAPVLARSPYEFPVVMEPDCRQEGMAFYCKQGDDDTAWLKRAFDAGGRFSIMVEKHRQNKG